jgi:SAM-dependent methyltransferase
MKWMTKAAIQRTLDGMPGGEWLYYLGQRSVGGFRRFTIDSKVQQAVSLLQALFESGEDVEGRSAIEIGTGWAPVVPLLFWAYGQERCETYDVSALLKDKFVVRTVDQLGTRTIDQAVTATDDTARQRRVVRRLTGLQQGTVPRKRARDILDACRIRYHGATDAAQTNLPDASIDLAYSNVVLEHVPPAELDRLFREIRRVLRPDGYMLHLIDPSDHFAHNDPSISSINFLRFSEEEFAKYNTTFLFQNRLRAPAWREMIERHHFTIRYWRTTVDSRALEQLPYVPVHPSFAHLQPEDLCTTAIWVVAQPQ